MRWRAYPGYKESGEQWVGSVPMHWDAKRLKYCVRLMNEKVEATESVLPYLGGSQITRMAAKPRAKRVTSGPGTCY